MLVSERPDSVLTSTDGQRWSSRDLGVGLSCIAYGSNRYVAGGQGGAIFTSTNGDVWEQVASTRRETVLQVCYGNDVFVGFSRDTMLRSTNGVDWEGREGSLYNHSLTFGNGLFVLGGGILGFTGLATSPDGIAWTDRLGHYQLTVGHRVAAHLRQWHVPCRRGSTHVYGWNQLG